MLLVSGFPFYLLLAVRVLYLPTRIKCMGVIIFIFAPRFLNIHQIRCLGKGRIQLVWFLKIQNWKVLFYCRLTFADCRANQKWRQWLDRRQNRVSRRSFPCVVCWRTQQQWSRLVRNIHDIRGNKKYFFIIPNINLVTKHCPTIKVKRPGYENCREHYSPPHTRRASQLNTSAI